MREVNGHQFDRVIPKRVPKIGPPEAGFVNQGVRHNERPIYHDPYPPSMTARRPQARGVRPEAQHRPEGQQMYGQLSLVLSDRMGWRL